MLDGFWRFPVRIITSACRRAMNIIGIELLLAAVLLCGLGAVSTAMKQHAVHEREMNQAATLLRDKINQIRALAIEQGATVQMEFLAGTAQATIQIRKKNGVTTERLDLAALTHSQSKLVFKPCAQECAARPMRMTISPDRRCAGDSFYLQTKWDKTRFYPNPFTVECDL